MTTHEQPKNPHVLVVDDFQEAAELAVMTLAMEGFDAACVVGGRQALSLIAKSQPYCILLDFHMPDMDGLEVAQQVRALYGDDIVLIVLTGAGDIETGRLKALVELADHHFLKPVDWSRLLKILAPLKDIRT